MVLVAVCAALALPACADELQRRHAISKLGAPAHGPAFQHLDWVNAQAPKGGRLNLSGIGSFDNVNDSTLHGIAAPGLGWLDARLFEWNPDEAATLYAAAAEWVAYPDDFSSATFALRPTATFHDGRPITPEDVVFSFEEKLKASTRFALIYKDVTKVEQTGPREVTFRFEKAGNRDLPYIVSQLAVLPRHYWTGRDATGQPRDLAKTTLEPPLGSGPYRIKSLEPGRTITFERVRDWWGGRVPVNVGQYNFDEINVSMYRDDVPEFVALKAGEIDFTIENSSKKWATGYEIAAVKDGHLKRLELPLKTVATAQGFAFNTRRAKFTDPRVRRAFALAFDFESANRSLFYGLYRRLDSYFDNSELAHRDRPAGRELEILEKLRDKVPPEVFTQPYRSPTAATADDLRRNLREAARLLDDAGWAIVNGVRRHKTSGEALAVEFLDYDTQFQRIVLPYKLNLEKIGIQLSMRVVDPSQYQHRLRNYDFDLVTEVYEQSHSPGNELRERWGSASADKHTSGNRMGIKNPAVDAIIEELLYARTRDDQIAAARALDRVLLWNHYLVLQWHNPVTWVAHWNKFGRPARHPSQDPQVQNNWWYDAAAAAKLEALHGKK